MSTICGLKRRSKVLGHLHSSRMPWDAGRFSIFKMVSEAFIRWNSVSIHLILDLESFGFFFFFSTSLRMKKINNANADDRNVMQMQTEGRCSTEWHVGSEEAKSGWFSLKTPKSMCDSGGETPQRAPILGKSPEEMAHYGMDFWGGCRFMVWEPEGIWSRRSAAGPLLKEIYILRWPVENYFWSKNLVNYRPNDRESGWGRKKVIRRMPTDWGLSLREDHCYTRKFRKIDLMKTNKFYICKTI